MPIIERDPWRMQYFENIACPDDVSIPTDDEHAYELFPEHRWIYNKLLVCDTQGLDGAPHGVPPPSFPVFSKPIYNMHGMGVGSRVFATQAELAANMHAGHMWMALAEGEHVSSDVVVIGGEAQWWRHCIGKALSDGVFDYWTMLAEERPAIEGYCGDWLRTQSQGLQRRGQHRNHRRPDHRGAPALRRPVAGPLRRGLARRHRRALRAAALALRRRRPPRRLQRRAVRRPRRALPAPAGRIGRRNPQPPRRHQRADHFPRGPAARATRDAAGRISSRHHQLLGSRGRSAGA